jgi:hypothetical protein
MQGWWKPHPSGGRPGGLARRAAAAVGSQGVQATLDVLAPARCSDKACASQSMPPSRRPCWPGWQAGWLTRPSPSLASRRGTLRPSSSSRGFSLDSDSDYPTIPGPAWARDGVERAPRDHPRLPGRLRAPGGGAGPFAVGPLSVATAACSGEGMGGWGAGSSYRPSHSSQPGRRVPRVAAHLADGHGRGDGSSSRGPQHPRLSQTGQGGLGSGQSGPEQLQLALHPAAARPPAAALSAVIGHGEPRRLLRVRQIVRD